MKDSEVCRSLVERVRRESSDPLDDPRTYGVFRFGDYHLLDTTAATYNEKGELTAILLHRIRVFAFRADSREFVAEATLPEWPPR